jgi:hypothetical protein
MAVASMRDLGEMSGTTCQLLLQTLTELVITHP